MTSTLLLQAHRPAPGAAAHANRPRTRGGRRPLPPRAAAPGDGGDNKPAAAPPAPTETKGGFGGGKAKGGAPPPVKVSKRGTLASRGGAPAAAQARAAYDALEARTGPASNSNAPQNQNFAPSSSSSPPVQEVSPIVNARMFRRMVTFAAIPIATGLVALPAAYYVKKVLEWDLPNWAVYAFQSVAWGGGLLGITYGIFSSSWDPGFEGSALGLDEAKANLGALVERGQRKRERGGE